MRYITIFAKIKYTKGDRIVVKFGKNEYYLGTVTKSGVKVSVLFDDGDRESLPAKSKRLIGIGVKRKRKSEITEKELKKYLYSIPKTKVKVSKIPTKTPESVYTKIKSESDDTKLKWCFDLWRYYNNHFFKKKLPRCTFRWTKDTGTTFNVRANYRNNVIGLNRRLFNANFTIFRKVFLHEMCHQATDKISKMPKEGHGQVWKNWMRTVGLSPERLDYEENDTYLTKDEIKKKEIVKKRKETVIKKEIKTYPFEFKPAKWFDADKNKWYKGMIVCPNDQAGKRWAFIMQPYSYKWQIIPSEWFYELSLEERKKILTNKDWKEAAEKVKYNIEEKRRLRKEKASRKKYIKTLFNY